MIFKFPLFKLVFCCLSRPYNNDLMSQLIGLAGKRQELLWQILATGIHRMKVIRQNTGARR